MTREQRLNGRPWTEQLQIVGEFLNAKAEEYLSTDPIGQGIRTVVGTYLDTRNQINPILNLGRQLDGLTRDVRAGWFWRGDTFRDGSQILRSPAFLPSINGGIVNFLTSSSFAVSAQYANQREYFGLVPDRLDYSSPEAYRASLENYRDNLYEVAGRFIPGGGEPVGTYDELFGPPHVREGFDVSGFWRNTPSPPIPPAATLTPPSPPPTYSTDRGQYLDRVDLRQTFHTYRASAGSTQTIIVIPGEPTQDYTEGTGNGEYLPDGSHYQRVFFPESENLHWARPNEIAYYTSPCGSLSDPATGCIDSPTAVCIVHEFSTYNPAPRYNYNYSNEYGYAYELEYNWSIQETIRMKHAGSCYVLGFATHSAQIVVTASDSTVPLSGGGAVRTITSGQSVQYQTNPVSFTLYFNDNPDPIPPPIPPISNPMDCCSCRSIAAIVQAAKTEILNELREEADATLLNRVYGILGGDSWFSGESDTTPSIKFNPENTIETARASAYNGDNPREIEAPNLLSVLSHLLSVNHHRQGLHEFPFSVPSNLALKNPEQINIHNYAAWQEWMVKQLDGLHGQYPIKIKYIDSSNREQTLEVPNAAEGIAEIIGILLSLAADTDIIQAAVFKAGVESMAAKVAATTAADYAAANGEFLGYKTKTVRRDLPFAFNPGAKNLKDALRESTQKSTKLVLDQDEDLTEYLKRLLVGVEIIRAAFYKPLSQGLPGEGIRDDIRGDDQSDTNWQEFLATLENPPTDQRQPGAPLPDVNNIEAGRQNP